MTIAVLCTEILNPKSEILNSKQIPITKFQNSKHVLDLGHLDFEFV